MTSITVFVMCLFSVILAASAAPTPDLKAANSIGLGYGLGGYGGYGGHGYYPYGGYGGYGYGYPYRQGFGYPGYNGFGGYGGYFSGYPLY